MGKAIITSARKVLNRVSGRCTVDSQLFVANRLLESNEADDVALGDGRLGHRRWEGPPPVPSERLVLITGLCYG